jgi:hypothetical protein
MMVAGIDGQATEWVRLIGGRNILIRTWQEGVRRITRFEAGHQDCTAWLEPATGHRWGRQP